MTVVEPRPNPETVEAVHDIVWRVAGVEAARTDALDRKAATLATFASVLTSLTATLGLSAPRRKYSHASLAALVSSFGFAVLALVPKEFVSLGLEYLERLPCSQSVERILDHAAHDEEKPPAR